MTKEREIIELAEIKIKTEISQSLSNMGYELGAMADLAKEQAEQLEGAGRAVRMAEANFVLSVGIVMNRESLRVAGGEVKPIEEFLRPLK